MSNPWYPITPHHPAPLVQVRGIVEFVGGVQGTYDAQIIISRGRPPHADVWASWTKGRATILPPRAKPLCWQPQDPEKWQAPLPEPLSTATDRLWYSKLSFGVVEEAEAAELAQEMERDRNDARRGPVHSAPPREPMQWWRDADKIKYEPRGQISPRMAEGRVMRAVALCGHSSGMYGQGTGMSLRARSILASMATSASPEDYATSDYVPRLRALPGDHSDFPIAMSWFTALNTMPLPASDSKAAWVFNREQEALAFRSFNIPLSYAEIGNQWGVSGETARQTYISAIDMVHRLANGVVPVVVDHMAELRKRNAAFKRGDDMASINKGAA